MKINIQREHLLAPLQKIIGIVERRHIKPILSQILLHANESDIWLTATDLKTEIVAHIHHETKEPQDITLPARKLLDICKSLPESALLELIYENDRAILRSGRSRFTLATLPPAEFPSLEKLNNNDSFKIRQIDLKSLLDRTAFAMAQQDVRYYLNGLLLELKEGIIKSVATDGHRLSLMTIASPHTIDANKQVILPRKAVLELLRLVEANESEVEVQLTSNHIRVNLGDLQFTSKLVDARYPDYTRVIPQNLDKVLTIECDAFQQALNRVSILSNEKFKGIRLVIENDILKIQAHNPEQEEAEEQIEVNYSSERIDIGFNVTYLLDVLAVAEYPTLELQFKDSDSSVLMKAPESNEAQYVVMPMRL